MEIGHEKIQRIVKSVIENEFNNIKENEEFDFTSTNKNYISLALNSDKLLDKIIKSENKNEKESLADDFLGVKISEYDVLNKFYFSVGVIAGLKYLNFLNEIDGIEFFIQKSI